MADTYRFHPFAGHYGAGGRANSVAATAPIFRDPSPPAYSRAPPASHTLIDGLPYQPHQIVGFDVPFTFPDEELEAASPPPAWSQKQAQSSSSPPLLPSTPTMPMSPIQKQKQKQKVPPFELLIHDSDSDSNSAEGSPTDTDDFPMVFDVLDPTSLQFEFDLECLDPLDDQLLLSPLSAFHELCWEAAVAGPSRKTPPQSPRRPTSSSGTENWKTSPRRPRAGGVEKDSLRPSPSPSGYSLRRTRSRSRPRQIPPLPPIPPGEPPSRFSTTTSVGFHSGARCSTTTVGEAQTPILEKHDDWHWDNLYPFPTSPSPDLDESELPFQRPAFDRHIVASLENIDVALADARVRAGSSWAVAGDADDGRSFILIDPRDSDPPLSFGRQEPMTASEGVGAFPMRHTPRRSGSPWKFWKNSRRPKVAGSQFYS